MATDFNVTLHYFPASFYSQKVVVALEEKGVSYNERFVNILKGEQLDTNFLKANKNGNVPVLEINGKFYAESEDIIDVIDKTFTSGPRLVPDVGSSEADAVRDFRKLLYDIPVDLITYGVIAHNEKFMIDKSALRYIPPHFTREGIKRKFLGEAEKLRALRETCDASLSDAIDKKIQIAERRAVDFLDAEKIGKSLEDLTDVFDLLDQRLKQTKRENPNAKETWLMGPTFTAVDISAAILMYRLEFVGAAPRYFSDTSRPMVKAYYLRLRDRDSMKKLDAKVDEMKKMFVKSKLISVGLTVAKIGLVVGLIGLGYVGFKSWSRSQKTS